MKPANRVKNMAVKEKEEVNTSDERAKALKLAIDKIEKDFGKGAIMKLGDKPAVSVETIPTGALALDVALGVGGIPRGRIIEIYGPESSGKTTLAQHIVAECQKRGGIAAFVDAEHALDPEYARNLGVNVDELLISQPDTGEQALDITEELVRSGAVDVIVVDSVAALVPKAEIEGSMEDQQMGLQARLMSKALRKLTGIIGKTRTTVIFINQLRQKIGVMYGNPETTTGGNALKYYASVRLEIKRVEGLKGDGEDIGNHVRVRILKNKVAPLSNFWKWASANYRQVLIVPGNHEYYNYCDVMDKGLQWKWLFKNNVGYYQNQVVRIDDTDFIMSTLWSRISPSDEYFVWKGMNDFRQIMYNGKLLQTEEFNQMHSFCLDFIKQSLVETTAKHIVVITHHLPTLEVVAPYHKDSVLNSAFATDLNQLIADNRIDAWIYGHSHTNIDAEIDGTKVVCNQMGYVFENEHIANGFDSGKYLVL